MTFTQYLRLFIWLLFPLFSVAQKSTRTVTEKCGTMPRLQERFQRNPSLRARFENQRSLFARQVEAQALNRQLRTEATVYIPVVFHVVMSNPNLVTNAQLQLQLDTLNKQFFGSNADSAKIPSYFKPSFGKSRMQFCLAQRTPDGEESTGINRKITSQPSFSIDDGVKHASSGGTESWDTKKYLNVWVCNMSGGILGYATFPDDGAPADQGVVIDYRSMPGGAYASYNGGKTLTHETGHFFNLFHIWGDDGGACYGSDDVADTPNQGDYTDGCPTGIKTDACTGTGNGIMYQNYMDYSFDGCLVMFTAGQVTRMEAALTTYRSSLLSSNGCQPVVRKAYDAQLRGINKPDQRLCTPAFTPAITLRNFGTQTLTAVSIGAQIDNGPVTTTNWTGLLVTATQAEVTLASMNAPTGSHVLTVFVYNPNGRPDEDKTNDTLRFAFQYYEPVTTVAESFEATTFPPPGWDIQNPDNSITWQRVTGIAKTGNASVKLNNAEYDAIGEADELRLPQINLPANTDSAFLSFQVAAAVYSSLSTSSNFWDTLEVRVSADCGQTFTSVYKKWAGTLVTRTTPVTSAFAPTANEWRRDSINLGGFIGRNNLLISFRNATGYENNVYLDDISLRTVAVNPNLRASGFLVTPNPTSGRIAVQFYPQPTGLKSIQLWSTTGQKLQEVIINNGQGSTQYNFDLSRYAPGVYVVRAVFDNKVLTSKILKL